MYENGNLSDTEDPYPRNVPKPSINNSDKFTGKPSVPEVSIIFDQHQPIKPNYNLLVERKSIIKSTPIIKNEPNPAPPKTTIPELSLIFEPNSNSYLPSAEITSILKENLPKQQIQTDKHKPSLPIKSFSSFKLKYGSLISSIENTTRKSVKFKPINENCVTNNEINTEQLNINDKIEEKTINEQEINTESYNIERKTVTDNNILEKLDSLTILVHSLFNEIKNVQTDIKDLKTSIKNETEQTNNCQNCNNLNNKIEEIIEFNEYIFNNMEYLTKAINSNEKYNNQMPKNNENANTQASEPHLTEENSNTTAECNSKPSKKVSVKTTANLSRPINCFKKSDLLETLPETEPILIFNNDVNRSLAMKELAVKYLTNDKYKIYINGNNTPVNLKTNFQFEPIINEQEILKKSNDLSIATYDYMKKYKLITDEDKEFMEPINFENTNVNNNILRDKDNLLVFQDIKKGPKFM